MTNETYSRLAALPALTPLNVRFAAFVADLDPGAGPELALAAALVSRRVEEGHVCLDLRADPRRTPWEEGLRASRVVGAPGDFTPLVLDDGGRLYLYRYWRYEAAVTSFVRERAGAAARGVDPAVLEEGLARYFPVGSDDRQRAAARAAVMHPFLVVSGGPGTGKTTTVVRILALWLEQPGGDRLRVALAAPTGKAATRLQDALRAARRELPASDRVLDRLPAEVATLHRLLGAVRGSSAFRHHEANPLAVDAVVVDEASMVDLPLLAKLTAALPPHARLLLLGDRDQLASVEAGAVLDDLCNGLAGEGGQGERTVWLLDHSYRFGAHSGIGTVSRAVRDRDPSALDLVRSGRFADVGWVDVGTREGDFDALTRRLVEGCAPFLRATGPAQAFEAFGRFQVLCALRRGPFGVEGVNERAERGLAAAGLVRGPRAGGAWYRGRPVLITANDYGVGLFNGDVGLTLPDPAAGGELRVFFPDPAGGFRSLPPARLPAHETAFALTVHKSQGSEFDEVVLVLGDRPSPVLTGELVYTGLTRARKRVDVWAAPAVFQGAVERRLERSTGLRDALGAKNLRA